MSADVVTQIKSLINSPEDQLTLEERNLLSIAFKNITGTLRNAWRIIDQLEKREAPRSTPHQVALMHLQKERIRRELDSTCRDIVELLENYLLKSASPGEERVFYSKMYVTLPFAFHLSLTRAPPFGLPRPSSLLPALCPHPPTLHAAGEATTTATSPSSPRTSRTRRGR